MLSTIQRGSLCGAQGSLNNNDMAEIELRAPEGKSEVQAGLLMEAQITLASIAPRCHADYVSNCRIRLALAALIGRSRRQ